MFNLLHKKSSHTPAVFIDSFSDVLTNQLSVIDIWQQSRSISSIGDVLSKSLDNPSNPLDAALINYTNKHGLSLPQHQPYKTLAFDPHVGISGNIWHHGEYYLPAIKGTPESILEYCDISDNERESIMVQLHKMSAMGSTVIAIATGLLQRPISDLGQLTANEKLTFIGFVSLQISASPEAKRLLSGAAINAHYATGQHPAAALILAKELGISSSPGDIFDARRLDVMTAAEIQKAAATVKIFARATPERKDHIFDALRASNKDVKRVSSLVDLQKLLAK